MSMARSKKWMMTAKNRKDGSLVYWSTEKKWSDEIKKAQKFNHNPVEMKFKVPSFKGVPKFEEVKPALIWD